MDTLFGIGIILVVGYFVLKWVLKEDKKPEETETKIEPAKKIESDFVTGLNVAKEEIKPAPVASLEPVVAPIVDKAREEVKADIDDKIVKAFVNAMVETATKAEPVVEEVKVQELKVPPPKVKTVKAKAKAIEAVVEAKTKQLEKAVVKKTKKVKK